jgi:hypothetical protein
VLDTDAYSLLSLAGFHPKPTMDVGQVCLGESSWV